MVILGINEGHESGACLFVDGRIVASASEERFSRQKNDCGWPRLAVQYCLAEGNITGSDLDKVAIATIALDPLEMRIKRGCNYDIGDYLRENEIYWHPRLIEGKDIDFYDIVEAIPYYSLETDLPYDFSFLDAHSGPKDRVEFFTIERRRNAAAQLQIDPDKVVFIDHHLCHAAYAYFASESRERTLVITADGWGDGANATVGIGEGNDLELVFRTPMNDLARIYRWSTLLLGMKPNEHEYKVMGLAPYAKEYITKEPYDLYKSTLQVDGLDFNYKVKPTDLYYWFKERFAGCRFDGIAGGLQRFTEELMAEWVGNCIDHYGIKKIVLSGGLALNIKANKRIAELANANEIFVAPGGGDTSVGVGAAYAQAACNEGGSRGDISGLDHAYLGPEFSNDAIWHAIGEAGIEGNYKVEKAVSADAVAAHLADGRVVARCCGRMEFGARALGNRSILANPGKFEVVQIINEKIKNRDFWMPFTPSILQERSEDYLVNPKKLRAPFMTMAFESTALARADLVAAIHPYDKTVRPQIVTRETNLQYYELIKAFERQTGIGALLNTSLNLHGDPVVCSPEDAIYTFEHSGLDMLLMNNILVSK